jgi:hypothetical protein
MTIASKGARTQTRTSVSYQLIRTTTSPDEQSTGVQSYVANLPAEQILDLSTEDNLRGYIAEYNPRKRNRVHDAIRETIETSPARLITRNGGVVITASAIQVDDKRKTIDLEDASIINGAQTQGEIKRYLAEFDDQGGDTPFHVRAEIIVDPDPAEVVETAIARNTATPVKSVTQAGARGHLDDLVSSIQKVHPSLKVKMSETDEDGLDPIRILQWTRLLMPLEVSGNRTPSELLRPYKNPAQCLADFSNWFEEKGKDNEKKAKYEFTVEMAPMAVREYSYWESHVEWNGHQLWGKTQKGRAVKRDKKTKNITWVSPGIVFPVMSAMSEFVVKDNGHWKLAKPSNFRPEDIIDWAIKQFRGHNSDPMAMGRSDAAYEALKIYPQTLVEVLRQVGNQ